MPSSQRRLPRPHLARLLSNPKKPTRNSDPVPSHSQACDSLPASFRLKQLDLEDTCTVATNLIPPTRPSSDSRTDRRRGRRMPSKWRVDRLDTDFAPSQHNANNHLTSSQYSDITTTTASTIELTHRSASCVSQSDQVIENSTESHLGQQQLIASEQNNFFPGNNNDEIFMEHLPPPIGACTSSEVKNTSQPKEDISSCSCTQEMDMLKSCITAELKELRRIHARTAESAHDTLRATALLETRIDELRVLSAPQPSPASVLAAMILDGIATILLFFIRLCITNPYKTIINFLSTKPQQDQNLNRCSWRLSGNGLSDDQFLGSVAKRLSFSATDWNVKHN